MNFLLVYLENLLYIIDAHCSAKIVNISRTRTFKQRQGLVLRGRLFLFKHIIYGAMAT